MVLKGVNWVHNHKIRSYGLERSQLVHTMIKIRSYSLQRSQFVYTIQKSRSYGLEKSQFATECKNLVIWS